MRKITLPLRLLVLRCNLDVAGGKDPDHLIDMGDASPQPSPTTYTKVILPYWLAAFSIALNLHE
jgi:hypothetical protein